MIIVKKSLSIVEARMAFMSALEAPSLATAFPAMGVTVTMGFWLMMTYSVVFSMTVFMGAFFDCLATAGTGGD